MTEPANELDVAQRERVWQDLLTWYSRDGRDLPWRHTRDPYAILVSEVMLQQTQVERVVPKYDEFLTRFPTLPALAAAPTAEVIRTWAPLGYNVRAVRLQQIAQAAVEQHGGSLPGSLEELLMLKGIGRYTAGAIACFAFGAPVATVDTNIRRVLWRVFRGIEPAAWPTGSATSRDALALAEWALPGHAAYDWQQALMDLGATICVSRQPRCERCPLARECNALAATAQQTLFPSGQALAQLRDISQSAGDTLNLHKRSVAEPPAAYRPRRTTSHRRASQPFTSTSRYFRGRILALLRQQEAGATLSLIELGLRIKADWSSGDLPWLRNLVSGLARDGLLRIHEPQPRDGASTSDTTYVGLP